MGYNAEIVKQAKQNASDIALMLSLDEKAHWAAHSATYLREAYQQSLLVRRVAVPGYDA